MLNLSASTLVSNIISTCKEQKNIFNADVSLGALRGKFIHDQF